MKFINGKLTADAEEIAKVEAATGLKLCDPKIKYHPGWVLFPNKINNISVSFYTKPYDVYMLTAECVNEKGIIRTRTFFMNNEDLQECSFSGNELSRISETYKRLKDDYWANIDWREFDSAYAEHKKNGGKLTAVSFMFDYYAPPKPVKTPIYRKYNVQVTNNLDNSVKEMVIELKLVIPPGDGYYAVEYDEWFGKSYSKPKCAAMIEARNKTLTASQFKRSKAPEFDSTRWYIPDAECYSVKINNPQYNEPSCFFFAVKEINE